MDITITPTKLSGSVNAIPSKSQAHRLLICAAFSDTPTTLFCPETNQDIEATADCLRVLGADIQHKDGAYFITPVTALPESAVLNCGESGSTLRFMLPVVGALGIDATFVLFGRLPSRPLSPLWEEMCRMGCNLSRPSANTIRCTGKLTGGTYTIDGGVSSQFITGLLFATALMQEHAKIIITGKIESAPYIEMTHKALLQFGVDCRNYSTDGKQKLHSPGSIIVEGDWSNSAFFLTANTLGSSVNVENLDMQSPQGDRAVAELLPKLQEFCTISVADIPDLVPILSVAACANQGAIFTDVRRLRLKESDRVETVAAMLRALGAHVDTDENSMRIYPSKLTGGTVDAAGDHRIAMAAAIAATIASGPVTIKGAQCVAKSYPIFWDEYRKLGGKYE